MTRGPRKSASSGWAIRSSKRVTASTMPSVVRPTYRPRLSDALGTPRGYTRAASSADSRGIQIEHEAEIWILPTGANHLARDRQIDGEDEQMRGIVFEHFAAEHDDLGALRRDAQSGAQGGVGGLGRHSREADGVGAREPELERPVVGGVRRDPIGEPSERQCAGRDESRVFSECRGGSRDSVGPPPGTGLQPLRASKTSRVQTSLPRRCRHRSNGTSSGGVRFAETSDSSARSRSYSCRNRQETPDTAL